MKRIIQAQEVMLCLLSVAALYYFKVPWLYYIILIIGPDISMLGYLAGKKIGAIAYNLFHHKAIGVVFFLLGFSLENWLLQASGIIIFGHSSMDRAFGYGLKYFTGFQDTHLGKIGQKKPISVNQTIS